MQGRREPAYNRKYVGDRGRRSAASSVIPAAQTLFRQTLLELRAPGQHVVQKAEVVVRPVGRDDEGGVIPASTSASMSSTFSCRIDVLRSISAGSRPTFSHQSSRTPFRCRIVSGSPKPCQMSACSATMRSVTFSPPPPIRIGIVAVTGGGLSFASRSLMTGRSRSRSREAACRGAELVAVLARSRARTSPSRCRG